MDTKKQMPRLMKKVHQQILEHPDYKNKLDQTTRWAFETGCVSGLSHCDKENNKWSREIWKYLYLNEDPQNQFKNKSSIPLVNNKPLSHEEIS